MLFSRKVSSDSSRRVASRSECTLISPLTRYFERASAPVLCAYLFGSHATGTDDRDSDVDLAILLRPDNSQGLLGPLTEVRGDVERMLGREADVIDRRRVPPDPVDRILRDGILLLDRDPDERALFEVAARNAYFDVLPYLREYRRGSAA